METVIENTFTREILEGLQADPKHLPSKYFYDEVGDRLFQQIMDLPEYYLTRTELKILEQNKTAIVSDFDPNHQGFDLVELGAGDGLKTKVLLHELLRQNVKFTYKPLDISLNALTGLKKNLQSEMKGLPVEIINGDYFSSLKKIKENPRHKLILFLGSNIGNLSIPEGTGFLRQLAENLNAQDGLLVGFDLKKDPAVILPAYNDASGVTAAFNKNLLSRINTELNANFNLNNFIHYPVYNPHAGTAKSYLVSTSAQSVYLAKLGVTISFHAWESIHTEISQKYSHNMIEKMAKAAGLKVKEIYTDEKNYYANYLFTTL